MVVRVDVGWAAGVLVAATVTNGIAAGATLDQAFKQLPARRHIGTRAYVDYVRAADMANGRIWYPIMGIGTALVSLAAVLLGLLAHPGPAGVAALLVVALGTLGHLGVTSRAAPTLLSLRTGEVDPARAAATLDRFARLNAIRAAGIVLALAATVAALAITG